MMAPERDIELTPQERGRDFPLYPTPIREIVRRGDDSGDIVFTWVRRWNFSCLKSVMSPVGCFCLFECCCNTKKNEPI